MIIIVCKVLLLVFLHSYASFYMVKEVFWTIKYDSKVFTKKISTNHGCFQFTLSYINGASTCNLLCQIYLGRDYCSSIKRCIRVVTNKIDPLVPHVSREMAWTLTYLALLTHHHYFIGSVLAIKVDWESVHR